jgi:uncharacterized protein
MPSEAVVRPTKCPLCGKLRAQEYRPFYPLSYRDRDLNQWFDEGYRVPAHEGPDTGADDGGFGES